MIVTLGTTPALQRTMTFATFTTDAVNRATANHECASGKGINVARVIHALGEPCVATGFLGGDSGAFCRRDMDASHVGHDFVAVSPKTRMCITLIDQSHHTATEVIEEAAGVTPADAQKLLEKLGFLLQHAKVLVLSGTLAPGCGDDFYARCLRLAHTSSVPVILDAKGPPLELSLAAKPFLVKPNRSELAATVNRPIETDADLRDAIRAIVKLGASHVVVTNGPEGTVVSDGREFWKLQSPKVQAVNPIGSGDSFAAGIAVGLKRGLSVPDACVLGVACGAGNAMTEFAGHARPEDVEQLTKQIKVERFS